jgi:methionyl-tRNA synthetase
MPDNYITALGYLRIREQPTFWPTDVHLIGKDILRFHGLLADISHVTGLYRKIIRPCWWTVEGQK